MEYGKELEQVLDLYGKDNCVGVFLSGSKLHGIDNEDSDTDLVVVVKQNLTDVVKENLRSDFKQLPGLDLKIYSSFKFLQLLGKGNPNMLELFEREPLLYEQKFKQAWDVLYNQKFSLMMLNPAATFKALNGIAVSNFKKGKMKRVWMAFYQAKNLQKEGKLSLTESQKIVLKGVDEFDESMTEMMLDSLKKVAEAHKDDPFQTELFDQLVKMFYFKEALYL